MKRQVYIDVTQLVHWQGQLTGIPRVIEELSTRFHEDGSAKFVTWDPQRRHYLEVDLMKSISNRGKQIYYIAGVNNSSVPVNKRPIAGMYNKVLNKIKSPTPGSEISGKVRFKSDDVLVIVWGEWHDQNFIDNVLNCHTEGLKIVQIVHDLLPIIVPQYSGSGGADKTFATYHEQIIPICSLVLAVSRNTKKDLESWLVQKKLHIPQIKVMRNGDFVKSLKSPKPIEREFEHIISKDSYILCVGTIEARKNHMVLYYAKHLALLQGITIPKIVIVGRKGWRTDDIYAFMTEDPIVKNDFIFLHNVDDQELQWLMQNCLFTIYPSLYEGWGLPIAESLQMGKAVIASSTSSMPEIGGDLVRYFNPYSTQDCLDAITKMLDDKNRIRAEKSLLNYKATSWDDTYKQVKALIGEYT